MNRVRYTSIVILTAFIINSFCPMPLAAAETSLLGAESGDYRLPTPGVRVNLSPPLEPPLLKGLKVHPENPFRFDFILDKGDSLKGTVPSTLFNKGLSPLRQESLKLIKYFLTSITVPEKDLWVNLSPYEKDRIMPQGFDLTAMGRDLLAEDYILKQITASLIYPEGEVGKKFWKRVYEEAAKRYGTTNIPVNTFNKVWIIPEKAVVYEHPKAQTVYVTEARLKVMLEQDYLSLSKHQRQPGDMSRFPGTCPQAGCQADKALNVKATQGNHLFASPNTSTLGSQIIRSVVLSELTKEVNTAKNFAALRQIYNSLILATWYKSRIKESILNQVYANQKKIAGVNIADPQEKQKIYELYLKAFKKGVYNYIKEERDDFTQQIIPRKYFSGGVDLAMTGLRGVKIQRSLTLPSENGNLVLVEAAVDQAQSALGQALLADKAMINEHEFDAIINKAKKEGKTPLFAIGRGTEESILAEYFLKETIEGRIAQELRGMTVEELHKQMSEEASRGTSTTKDIIEKRVDGEWFAMKQRGEIIEITWEDLKEESWGAWKQRYNKDQTTIKAILTKGILSLSEGQRKDLEKIIGIRNPSYAETMNMEAPYKEQIVAVSSLDPLTDLPARAQAELFYRGLLNRPESFKGIVVFDVNRFKMFNELWGLVDGGDEALKAVAKFLKKNIVGAESMRGVKYGRVTRQGGDEFALFLSFGTSFADAEKGLGIFFKKMQLEAYKAVPRFIDPVEVYSALQSRLDKIEEKEKEKEKKEEAERDLIMLYEALLFQLALQNDGSVARTEILNVNKKYGEAILSELIRSGSVRESVLGIEVSVDDSLNEETVFQTVLNAHGSFRDASVIWKVLNDSKQHRDELNRHRTQEFKSRKEAIDDLMEAIAKEKCTCGWPISLTAGVRWLDPTKEPMALDDVIRGAVTEMDNAKNLDGRLSFSAHPEVPSPAVPLKRRSTDHVGAFAIERADKAMKNPGGIDLNPTLMHLKTQDPVYRGQGIKLSIDPAMLARLRRASGFVPVVMDISPMTDLKLFLE